MLLQASLGPAPLQAEDAGFYFSVFPLPCKPGFTAGPLQPPAGLWRLTQKDKFPTGLGGDGPEAESRKGRGWQEGKEKERREGA